MEFENEGIGGNLLLRLFTVFLFIILALSGAAFAVYMLVTATNVLTLLLAIAFLMLACVSGFFNVTSATLYYRSYFYYKYIKEVSDGLNPMHDFPTVAVVVPVFNEEVKMVERNMLRLKTMDYPKSKMKFYLLDDSTNEIRNIQRRGRAGRIKFGQVVILVTRGTKDETYLMISRTREKRMRDLVMMIKNRLDGGTYSGNAGAGQTTLQ